ncbi:amino acid adenylation domain-containing protein [Kitasatospora sp. NPDC093550]|uniref:non-ribosomal peptide synthetase n=1 Tax=Kitasatospora sp. NPDC093550 TaxID=3364089 RepID=UPI0037FE672E
MSETTALRERLSPAQRAALAARLAEQRRTTGDRIRPRDPEATELPASFAQQRLWFLEQLAAGRPIYNVPFTLRIRGALDVDALRAALGGIVARHEILRTALVNHDGTPVQRIDPAGEFPLPVRDLGRLSPARRPAEIERLARAEAARPFDLAGDPLLRAVLLRTGEDEHVLLLTMHHIAVDGWSLNVVAGELAALYEDFAAGRSASLPELPVQYADFALWQQSWVDGPDAARQIAYWTERLRGLATLELPTDRPRPDHPPFTGERAERALPDDLLAELERLSQAQNATLFMTVLTVFQILLHRYTGQDEVVVGSPFAGRAHREVEPLIGMFANMLVLRTAVDGERSFRELLAAVKETVLTAEEHQHAPFERLVDELRPERDPSRNPLFQISFSLQSASGDGFRLPGLEVEELPVDSGTSRFDMAFNVEARAGGYRLWADYSTELWDRERIDRMFGHYETLLRAVLADPDRPVRDLPLLTEDERRQLVTGFNDTAREFPADTTLDALVGRRAAAQPDHPAVVMDGTTLSYARLDAAADALAARLGELGGPGRTVAVCLNRSPELVVALLGILRSGAAYLPLDPNDPPGRRAGILADTAATAVIAAADAELGLPPGLPVLTPLSEDVPATPAPRAHGPADPAYVIFTSGSTGTPKGVVVEHAAAVNFVTQVNRLFALGPDDRMLQFANPTFDVSVFEIFAALTSGATLCMTSREVLLSPDRLGEFIKRNGITVMDMAPAVMALLPAEEFASLRIVFVGGEAFPSSLVNAWNLPGRRFFNGYGPTEATVTCVVHECQGRYQTSPPIGRPLGNYRAYVLDRYGNPQPAGVPGELHLGGTGLARGYLNRPELTAERFPVLPVDGEEQRLYRTGDLVRQRWDGELVFLGRIDRQVKMRGLRIELGEVEAALTGHPAVRQGVVELVGTGAEARLVAYVVPDGACDAATLRAHLGTTLATHMIPSQFVWLEALPLTSSGKVDLARLPRPEPGVDRDTAYVPPTSETERLLVDQVIGSVLRVEEVGVLDNFFDLGGNSLQATQLAARIRSTFDTDIDLQAIYRASSMAELAALIDDARTAAEQAADAERLDLAAEIAELTDDEVAALLLAETEGDQA